MIMIGMDFLSFLTLLIIAAVVAGIAHYGLNYYVKSSLDSFFSKVIIAWLGGWLGSPVFGQWFDPLVYQGVYIIPAILGAIAAIILAVDLARTFAPARVS